MTKPSLMTSAINSPGSVVSSVLSVYSIPTLCLYALPVVVSTLGIGPVTSVILLVAIFGLRSILGIAAFGARSVYVLESITPSHYVELIRWSLDKLGVEYVEVESVTVLGAMLFQRIVPTLHIPGVKTSISDSPDIMNFLYARHMREESASFLRPVLDAEDVELETLLTRAAYQFRRWAYWQVLGETPKKDLLMRIWGVRQPHVPAWQAMLMNVSYPLVRAFVVYVRVLPFLFFHAVIPKPKLHSRCTCSRLTWTHGRRCTTLETRSPLRGICELTDACLFLIPLHIIFAFA